MSVRKRASSASIANASKIKSFHPNSFHTCRAPSHCFAEPLENRCLFTIALTATDVTDILAAAASQAAPDQVITVVDRNGDILGVFARDKAQLGAAEDEHGRTSGTESILLSTVAESVDRARTVAFFESNGDAFTTRTARFIIQDHFPQPVDNTPGGPLYGVEFSQLPFSDVVTGTGLSGDPGGIPLFIHGVAVGGIGVAGDGSGVLARADLPYNPQVTNPKNVFDGQEESDFDEAVALAGAADYMAPTSIRADKIFINGLRLPFTKNTAADAKPSILLSSLIDEGAGNLILASAANTGGLNLEGNVQAKIAARTTPTVIAAPKLYYPKVTIDGDKGVLKNPNPSVPDFGFTSGVSEEGQQLSVNDVQTIISNTVKQALDTRAGIRQPLGVHADVHVVVTDLDGNVLGVFAMGDATNFSYDVAVQKARTAAFFSDDTHAFSTRAVGFLSQRYFPPGIGDTRSGPLYEVQNELSLETPAAVAPLQNGITIFPGGEPLYKNGVLVGAIGVSGDGVDQDDFMSYAGTAGFLPPQGTRSDQLSGSSIVGFLEGKLKEMQAMYPSIDAILEKSEERLSTGLQGTRLPYVKFPRDPLVK